MEPGNRRVHVQVADESQDDGGVTNSSEARQLALYLFWNIVGRDLSR
jgi:hypothetical protein